MQKERLHPCPMHMLRCHVWQELHGAQCLSHLTSILPPSKLGRPGSTSCRSQPGVLDASLQFVDAEHSNNARDERRARDTHPLIGPSYALKAAALFVHRPVNALMRHFVAKRLRRATLESMQTILPSSPRPPLFFTLIALVCVALSAGCGDDDTQPALDGSIDACASEPTCPPGEEIVLHGDGGVPCSPETATCVNLPLCGGGSFSCVAECNAVGCAAGEFGYPNTMPPPANGLRWTTRSSCGESFQCGGCVEGPASCPDEGSNGPEFPVIDERVYPRDSSARYSCDDGLYRCEPCCPWGSHVVDACTEGAECFEGGCSLLCELNEDCGSETLCVLAGGRNAGGGACPPDADMTRCRQGTCDGNEVFCVTTCRTNARLVAPFSCDPDSCEFIDDGSWRWCEGGDWTDCDSLPTCDEGDEQTAVFGECPEDAECYVRSECGHTLHCQI